LTMQEMMEQAKKQSAEQRVKEEAAPTP